MATRVLMPKGSDTMTEGKVLTWMKQEGDSVSTGESILEIETDKVNMEVEALSPGVLRKILVAAGEMVPVGRTLAVIAGREEDISSVLAEEASDSAATAPPESKPAPPGVPPVKAKVAASVAATPAPAGLAPSMGQAPGGRVLASPMARRLAGEKGLDLSRIAGTGPSGRIIREDVERAAANSQRLQPAKAAPAAAWNR